MREGRNLSQKFGNIRLGFLVGEIAAGVRAVPMTIGEGCAGAEAAATEGKVFAGGATTADFLLAFHGVIASAQFLEHLSAGFVCCFPDVGELLVLDIVGVQLLFLFLCFHQKIS